MTELFQEQIYDFAVLEHQSDLGRPLDPRLLERLKEFGSDLRDISTNMGMIIFSRPEYEISYHQFQKVVGGFDEAGQRLNDTVTGLDDAVLKFAGIRSDFKRTRENFVNDHLGQTSDVDQLEALQAYVFSKGTAAAHKESFEENPVLERLMDGCKICDTYFDLSKDYAAGLLKQLPSLD